LEGKIKGLEGEKGRKKEGFKGRKRKREFADSVYIYTY